MYNGNVKDFQTTIMFPEMFKFITKKIKVSNILQKKSESKKNKLRR